MKYLNFSVCLLDEDAAAFMHGIHDSFNQAENAGALRSDRYRESEGKAGTLRRVPRKLTV